MEIMKPIACSIIPSANDGFAYEVKYDGFRAILQWNKDNILLLSRNEKDLTNQFPEIIHFCLARQSVMLPFLPLTLDGELVILNTFYQANFSLIQQRGKLKNKEKIENSAKARPASFLAFDILLHKGKVCTQKDYKKRKTILHDLFKQGEMGQSIHDRLSVIKGYENPNRLRDIVFEHNGEGMIAKRIDSTYSGEKKHYDWFKIKNWRTVQGVLTHFNTNNGYFTVQVLKNDTLLAIGKCKHGLDSAAFNTLKKLFLTEGEDLKNGEYKLPPAICASIHTLALHHDELREPEFSKLLPSISPQECTINKLRLDLTLFPTTVEITNTDKYFWPNKELTKGDLLIYLRDISPYMIPFLKERALTIIRCPDGINKTSFFQKQLPPYVPSFIKRVTRNEKKIMVCDQLDSLIWLANHGAIEYHVSFQMIEDSEPTEITFDLDPPSRDTFDLAIHAAIVIKKLLEGLELVSFVKTSGNKGLQIHIPILPGTISYSEALKFTEAIALTIVNAYPEKYTIERFKKDRKGRLYIDYVQHGKDKTLIAPYSPRKTEEATVAMPLFWNEVKVGLMPDVFTIDNVVERVQAFGCPFAGYFEAGQNQNLDNVLQLLKK